MILKLFFLFPSSLLCLHPPFHDNLSMYGWLFLKFIFIYFINPMLAELQIFLFRAAISYSLAIPTC